MQVGKFYKGIFLEQQPDMYLALGAESTPHKIYELRIQTEYAIPPEQEEEIVTQLFHITNPGMRTLGIDVSGNSVTMQVTGSPFFWAPLIAIIPSIIGPLVALVLGVIFLIRVPDWAFVLPFIGGGAAIALWGYGKYRQG